MYLHYRTSVLLYVRAVRLIVENVRLETYDYVIKRTISSTVRLLSNVRLSSNYTIIGRLNYYIQQDNNIKTYYYILFDYYVHAYHYIKITIIVRYKHYRTRTAYNSVSNYNI